MYVDARYSIRSDLSHVLAARKVEKGQVSLRVIHQMGIITLDGTDTRWMKPGTSAIFTTVSRTKPGLCLTECTFCMTIDHTLFASSSKVRQLSKWTKLGIYYSACIYSRPNFFFLHSYQSISTHLLQNDKMLQSQLTSINHLTYDVGALATCAGHQEGRKCVANDNNDWSSFLTFIFTDIVCVMQQNHPCILIALWATLRIGAVPALINNNLSQDPLLHCLTVAKTSLLLFDRVYEPGRDGCRSCQGKGDKLCCDRVRQQCNVPDRPVLNAFHFAAVQRYRRGYWRGVSERHHALHSVCAYLHQVCKETANSWRLSLAQNLIIVPRAQKMIDTVVQRVCPRQPLYLTSASTVSIFLCVSLLAKQC